MDGEGPTDPKQPAKMALVVVSDENLSKEADEGKWQEQLVKPLWKLVTEAINRPAALKRVSNVNAQVAHGTLIDAVLALTISIAWSWFTSGSHSATSNTARPPSLPRSPTRAYS